VLMPTAELMHRAQAASVGLAAFNGITIEHGEAIVEAAEAVGTSVVLALSHNAVRFHGGLAPITLAYQALAEAASVDVALHLDHVEDLALIEEATAYRFGSMMYDGATLPYSDNVAATREATTLLHGKGIWVEAELGEVGGKDGAHSPHARTDPAEAARFVAQTGVDSLAVAVGSSHAMTDRTAELDLDLVSRLRDSVPVPLVLHGSSGVSDEGIAAAVAAGLVKINVGTQLNIAYTDAVRAGVSAATGPDPRKYLAGARSAMVATVAGLIRVISQSADV
jgi:fructose-bisphosphate aldolase class II